MEVKELPGRRDSDSDSVEKHFSEVQKGLLDLQTACRCEACGASVLYVVVVVWRIFQYNTCHSLKGINEKTAYEIVYSHWLNKTVRRKQTNMCACVCVSNAFGPDGK